jgi:hypothetical protein
MICVICQRNPVEKPYVCPRDRTWLDGVLRDIGELHPQLHDALTPTTSGGERVTGTPEAPLPLAVGPLDLTMPARALALTDAGKEARDDQIGELSVASRLDSWVDDWRTILPREGRPLPTVARLVQWLRDRLERACDLHEAIDEFAAEMRQIRRTMLAVLGQLPARPERVWVPCRNCDQLTLYRWPGDDRVRCEDDDCALVLYPDEYERWIGLLAAQSRGMA